MSVIKISFGTSELKQLRFTGNMDRYATISPILKAIARTTNLQIKIEGREILTLYQCSRISTIFSKVRFSKISRPSFHAM